MKTFPVTESTLSAVHLGAFLQQKYTLSTKTVCRLFRTGMNHLYLVSDGESKFVLRIYTLNWRTQLEIAEELRLLVHLKHHDMPISYPIADRTGEYMQALEAPEGSRYAVLFSFCPGKKNPRFTPTSSFHIGVTMAKMHQLTTHFTLDRVTYTSKTLLADSLTRTASFFGKEIAEMKFVENMTLYLMQEYEKVNTSEVRDGALHLDIWFDNMHFHGEHELSIFDFDFCGNGWLCHDIAYFLFQLYNTNPDEKDYLTKSAHFMKGYESITNISEEEKKWIPQTGLAVMLFYLGIQCDRFDNWSNVFLSEDHLKRFVAILKKWIHYHHLPIEA